MEHSDKTGTSLGQYRLIEKLGEGAAGEVYRAEHDILEREYAVKIVHARLAHNEQFRKRFFREARLAARLVHPHIVRVVTADRHDKHFYLVMEYVDGQSLEEISEEGLLPVRKAVGYIEKVLHGLQYAHDEGMLHRDVKAANVLIDSDDQPRLADFGLVVDVNEGSDLTAQDAVVGTPYYMAPEQWKSQQLDARADVFSAGVLLYYLLSGEFPFPGDTPLEVMYRITKAPADALQMPAIEGVEPTTSDKLSDKLSSIVSRSIERKREQRPDTAGDFARMLSRWLEQAQVVPKSGLSEQTRPADDADNTADDPAGTPSNSAPTSPSTSTTSSTKRNHEMNQQDTNLETDYVKIAEGTYWVGKRPSDEIFFANPYLRTSSGQSPGDSDFNLLIDPGSSKDFSVVQSKVSQVIGSVKNVDSVFINHQDPDVGSSVGLMLGRYTPDAHVLCTEDTWRLVHYYNIPRKRFVPLEKYPDGIKLPSGDVVLPVPSPFCHFVGAMMLYDPNTRVLFSGDLFGGLTDRGATGLYADESDWTGMRAFHQIYMPTKTAVQNAIDNIRALDPPVKTIAPQHGRVIAGDYVQEFMERLYDLPVGLDILDDRNASDEELQAWTTVLSRVADVARTALGDRVEEVLANDPNLSGHITFQDQHLTVENLGKTSVERAVRLLCDAVPPETANSIKYEVVYAAEELDLPTPQVELDEDGDDGATEDTDSEDASAHFGVA